MLSLYVFFFFNDTATTEIYTYCHTLSLHDALPISRHCSASIGGSPGPDRSGRTMPVRNSRRARRRAQRSEEHTSELQSLMRISYAVFCLKKKKRQKHSRCRWHIS